MPESEQHPMDNSSQIEFWNGDAGEKWVQHAGLLDHLLAPFIPAILDAADLQPGEGVLDIGCGAGALSLGAAEMIGTSGRVTGVDVSKPLLGLARDRAAASSKTVQFEEADASAYRSETPMDAAISRFGVMFFSDPVAAFSVLRRNLRPEGRLVFACWQGIQKNEWLKTPLEVAMPYFKSLPDAPAPRAPGPFAFADSDYVSEILHEAGWRGLNVMPWTGALSLPGESIDAQATFILKMGPVARLIADQVDDPAPIFAALKRRLSDMKTKTGDVKLGAAAWIVSAYAS